MARMWFFAPGAFWLCEFNHQAVVVFFSSFCAHLKFKCYHQPDSFRDCIRFSRYKSELLQNVKFLSSSEHFQRNLLRASSIKFVSRSSFVVSWFWLLYVLLFFSMEQDHLRFCLVSSRSHNFLFIFVLG